MLERLRRKAQKLVWFEFKSLELAPGLDLEISPEELQVELAKIPAPLFLGRYAKEEIRAKLELHGILPALRGLGFEPLIVDVETDGLIEHRIFIHLGERTYDKILVELRLREGIFKVRETIVKIKPGLIDLLKNEPIPMLWIDWLLLQNPLKKFSPQKLPLPEQKYPGLGVLNLVVPLIGEFGEETHKQAVMDIPEHFHGAFFYSKWMKFFNPEMEGKMAAILRDLSKYSMAVTSWAILLGCLFNIELGRFEEWKPGEQIFVIKSPLADYFGSSFYREVAERAFRESHYRLDFSRMKEKMKFLQTDEVEAVEAVLAQAEKA